MTNYMQVLEWNWIIASTTIWQIIRVTNQPKMMLLVEAAEMGILDLIRMTYVRTADPGVLKR
jgi:hypothetical protein